MVKKLVHNDTPPEPGTSLREPLRDTPVSAMVDLPADDPVADTFDPQWIRQTRYLRWKRNADIALASTLMVLLAPAILITAAAVKASSPGPAFYMQTRMGRFGHPYRIIKLRSMRTDAERKSGAVWATKRDSRVTLVGRILRKTHLDELPQLWNVLRGEMSMVGPRPERPEFLPMLSSQVPNYARRLLVAPGVSGLAQVYLPPDTDIASVTLKTAHDLHYLRIVSLSLDLRLMAATALQAGGVPHGLVRRLFWLPRPESISLAPVTEPAAATTSPDLSLESSAEMGRTPAHGRSMTEASSS